MRKVLSLVLVLALVLSSFSMAFAADTSAASLSDINGTANEDAITVCYDLGIVTGNPDGTFQPSKSVTRAEFAAMITRALNIPDSALAGYSQTKFKDTAGYSWATKFLGFCESKGIMLGDGAGNVMPGRTITVNEAVTMALRAIGYTANSSLLVGSWPANYVTIAQNEDLYDDVVAKDVVDKASAAQIVYNLLTVQKVSVDSDGSTDYLWVDGKESKGSQNILNSNHDCDDDEDVILGTSGYSYDDAKINVSKRIGAYGDAYMDDNDLIAFTVDDDNVILTGELNDDMDTFEVGDVEYDIDNSDNDFTSGAIFFNGDYVADKSTKADALTGYNTKDGSDKGKITVEDIYALQEKYSDDGDTITLSVDLSGKTINDVYAAVVWQSSDEDLADSDVQDDIADSTLLSYDFVEDDDKTLDMKSFELTGVNSLSAIAEDDVVYVYADDDDEIRKVAVGPEALEGTVEEVDEDTDSSGDTVASTITIAGKDYDVSALATSDAKDIDSDSEGTFYIDAYGEVYDFDGTSGEADTYAIVEAYDTDDEIDNPRLKLYTSDDSDHTYDLAESDPLDEDMDWTTKSKLGSVTVGALAKNVLTPGALIGYSLDSNGDIDTLDVTSKVFTGVNFQSKKVLKTPAGTFDIDSACVVFTYKGDMANDDDYDTCDLSDVETGDLAGKVGVLVNDDDDVVAIFLEEGVNTTDDDYIYGVVDSATKTKDASGDSVSKYKGFIDGVAFTYLADDEYKVKGGYFDLYRIDLDSKNVITEIKDIDDAYPTGYAGAPNEESGYINAQPEQIVDLDDDNTVITTKVGTTEYKYTVDDKAVVYEWDDTEKEWIGVSKLSALDDDGNFYVRLYDTKGSDADGIATVVLFYEK